MYYAQHLLTPSCSLNLCVRYIVHVYNYLSEASFTNKYAVKGKLFLGKLFSFGYNALFHICPP